MCMWFSVYLHREMDTHIMVTYAVTTYAHIHCLSKQQVMHTARNIRDHVPLSKLILKKLTLPKYY